MALPTAVRDRLAELILAALSDADARRALASLAAAGGADAPEGAQPSRFESPGEWDVHAAGAAAGAAIAERARRAWGAIAQRAVDPRGAGLDRALDQAAALFDAGLYFEVHELLEPHWIAAGGHTRRTLQGLIQIAVGFEHLADGNAQGARSLLRSGSTRVAGGDRLGRELRAFARAVEACADRLDAGARASDVKAPRFPATV